MLTSFHEHSLSIIIMILFFVTSITIFMMNKMMIYPSSPIITLKKMMTPTILVVLFLLSIIPSPHFMPFIQGDIPFYVFMEMQQQLSLTGGMNSPFPYNFLQNSYYIQGPEMSPAAAIPIAPNFNTLLPTNPSFEASCAIVVMMLVSWTVILVYACRN